MFAPQPRRYYELALGRKCSTFFLHILHNSTSKTSV
jgi:hypothetical protein